MPYGLYDASNKIRYTAVDGLTRTGLMANDGSVNVVLNDVSNKGLYHPCGAYRVNSTPGTTTYDASGAYYLNHLLGSSG